MRHIQGACFWHVPFGVWAGLRYSSNMSILMFILIATFAVLAAIHAAWAFGIWFPWRDEAVLVRAVIGGRGVTRMPGPIPCGLVAAALGALAFSLMLPSGWLVDVIQAVAAVVLVGRGLITYLPQWRLLTPQEPFATYDRRFYGPLAIGLGLGLAIVVLA